MSSTGRGITIAGASAGSGKTYRLTKVVCDAVRPGAPERLDLESLVAVTYTRKAHAELQARIRRTLVGAGAFDEALRLPLAYLGTVHAACLRLLQEFAIDAGLSPHVDVVAGDAAKLLRQSLEASLPPEARQRLDELAWKFKLRHQPMTKRVDWLGPVSNIMDLARSNRISPSALAQMAERSARGLIELLPPKPEKDGGAIDAALARELAKAERALSKLDDDTKVTAHARDLIVTARGAMSDDELDWATWAKLAGIKASKAADPCLEDLRGVASRYEVHPRFRAELTELTLAIYDGARVGLSGYQAWKERRRVVDYVDMLDRALDLVTHPRVEGVLRERLDLVVVDEFQDTSPIQLALFIKLHALAQRSVWVGDRKQCIFEYAGADPRLMDDVARWVEKAGGKRDVLETNYRSRPELVELCSELFAAALSRHGFARDEIVVKANRKTPPALAKLAPVGFWGLEVPNAGAEAGALAAGVARMLAAPAETPVLDRAKGEVRDVRPGDIAVLVATNDQAAALAAALHTRGIRAAIARPGLLETPEGALTDAALRWLVDERDTLAAAKIDALLGFGGRSPDDWLGALLPAEAGADLDSARDLDVIASAPWRLALEAVRARLAVLSPSEAVDQVLAALDLVHLCARWPDAPQRIANLDALRALAVAYEDRCKEEREAGTIAGLLRHFDEMRSVKLQRDEMIASDDQHVPTDDGAVVVSTYHRAKGLEWPVVVLSSLNKKERRDAFDVCPESDRAAFDPRDPLAGRWIRYWPWPFGTLKTVPMAEAAEASKEGLAVAEREEKERARLLYVGFTRARDHLVIAARLKRVKGNKLVPAHTRAECVWLESLSHVDADGASPLVTLPTEAEDGATDAIKVRTDRGKTLEAAARVWRFTADDDDPADDDDRARREPWWFARQGNPDAGERPSYWIKPSSADRGAGASATIGEVVKLPAAMPLDGKVAQYDVFGDAVHAFFAADVEGLTAE
ncbi:MAG: UvrD-helicase domain-containing protein, partial [Myxococcales bacterium]|nr:UvrD-helicase domain-containing protein [Myxococcales bacterium]